jgi:TetR/AcrR family transcriptional regulator
MEKAGQATSSRKRHARPEETAVRGRLLESAIDIFNQRGYAASTVREIVEASGVTKPVLYYYFGSKEGIYTEIMTQVLENFRQSLAEPGLPGTNSRVRIQHLCEKIYTMAHENVKVVRLIHAIFYGPPQGAPPCFRPETFHDLFHEAIVKLVREGIRSGEFSRTREDIMAYAIEGVFNFTIDLELAPPGRSIGIEGLRSVLEVIFAGMKGLTKEPKREKKA